MTCLQKPIFLGEQLLVILCVRDATQLQKQPYMPYGRVRFWMKFGRIQACGVIEEKMPLQISKSW